MRDVQMKFSLAITIAAVMVFSPFASADIVTTYTYDFSDGIVDASQPTITVTNPYMTQSGFDTLASTTDQAGTLGENSGIKNGAAWVNMEIIGGAPGITGDCYQTVSFSTANWTDQMTLDRLQFDLSSFGMGGPPQQGVWLQIDVHASTDGFASEDISLGSLRITQTDRTSPPPAGSFDESFPTEFKNLNRTTLDFRFITTSNTFDNGVETRLDNVAFTFTAVPEPTSGILLTGVLLLGAIRRRR